MKESTKLRKPTKYFLVDAFTETAFKGNPAAVCLPEEEETYQQDGAEEWFQAVAKEFNISQTCFLTRIKTGSDNSNENVFRLRWFTPVLEVPLCGHATLAAAHVLFSNKLVKSDTIEFVTLSGILTARKVSSCAKKIDDSSSVAEDEMEHNFQIELNFPAVEITECDSTDSSLVSKALNGALITELKTTAGGDILVELPTGKDVADLQPSLDEIEKFPGRGVIVTAAASPESGFSFISRFFCPKYGIPEDPVCGSAHCALTTYWSEKLHKNEFIAYQASKRGGILELRLDEQSNRVHLRGKAVTVMEGSILV